MGKLHRKALVSLYTSKIDSMSISFRFSKSVILWFINCSEIHPGEWLRGCPPAMRRALLLGVAAALWQCGNLISTDLAVVGRLLGSGENGGSVHTVRIPVDKNIDGAAMSTSLHADVYLPAYNSRTRKTRTSAFPTIVSFTSQSKSAFLRWPWGALWSRFGNYTGFISPHARIGQRLAAKGIALLVVELPGNPNASVVHTVACGHEQFARANAISWLFEQPWCESQSLGSLGLGPGDSTCNEMWALFNNTTPKQSFHPNLRASALLMTPFDIFDEHYAPGGDPVSVSGPREALFPQWLMALEDYLTLPLWVLFGKRKPRARSRSGQHASTANDRGNAPPFTTGYREDYSEDKIGAMFPASRWATAEFQNNIPTLSIASWHVGTTARGASRRHLARDQAASLQSSQSLHSLVVGSWGGAASPLEVMAHADVQSKIVDFFVSELFDAGAEVKPASLKKARIQFAQAGMSGFKKTPSIWLDTHWPFEARIAKKSGAGAYAPRDRTSRLNSNNYVGLGLSENELQAKRSEQLLCLEPNGGQYTLEVAVVSSLDRKRFDISNIPPRRKMLIPTTGHNYQSYTPRAEKDNKSRLRFTSAPLVLSVQPVEGDSASFQNKEKGVLRVLGTPRLRLEITTTNGAPRDATIHAELSVGLINSTSTVLSEGRLRIGAGKSGVGEGPYMDVPSAPWRSFLRRDDVPRLPGKMSVVTIPMEPIAAVLTEGDVLMLALWLELDGELNATQISMWVGGMGGSGLKLSIV